MPDVGKGRQLPLLLALVGVEHHQHQHERGSAWPAWPIHALLPWRLEALEPIRGAVNFFVPGGLIDRCRTRARHVVHRGVWSWLNSFHSCRSAASSQPGKLSNHSRAVLLRCAEILASLSPRLRNRQVNPAFSCGRLHSPGACPPGNLEALDDPERYLRRDPRDGVRAADQPSDFGEDLLTDLAGVVPGQAKADSPGLVQHASEPLDGEIFQLPVNPTSVVLTTRSIV